MQEETISRIEAEIEGWDYLKNLPELNHGFYLCRKTQIIDNMYDIYSYVHNELHKKAVIYYHEETHEFKVRIYIGLIELCCTEFIAARLDDFERLLRFSFDGLLEDMSNYSLNHISSFLLKKGIIEWGESSSLPEECEGFSLFIPPKKPEKVNNGSYVIINYVDFAIKSDFTIYYNMYRDEFFSEARIWNIPDVNYDFDSTSLGELSEKLKTYMIPRLRTIRQSAEKESLMRKKTTNYKHREGRPVQS